MRLAQPICSKQPGTVTEFPFDLEVLDVGTEKVVGYTADTSRCATCGGATHVQINGWILVTDGGMYWLDNAGICYRTRSLHPFT